MSTWYRVEPNNGDPGKAGEIALCFKYLVDAFHYVSRWHGTDCVLYEIEGDSIVERVEDVQIDYDEIEYGNRTEDRSEHVLIPVAEVKMRDWWQIGDFKCRTIKNGGEYDTVIQWEFTPCRRVGETGELRR